MNILKLLTFPGTFPQEVDNQKDINLKRRRFRMPSTRSCFCLCTVPIKKRKKINLYHRKNWQFEQKVSQQIGLYLHRLFVNCNNIFHINFPRWGKRESDRKMNVRKQRKRQKGNNGEFSFSNFSGRRFFSAEND